MKKLERISQGLVVVLLLSIVSISGAQHEQGVWEERHAPMPTQRQYYSASAVNGKIYAIGGSVWNNGEPIRGRVLGIVEEYNPATNQWRRRANMGIARASLSSSAVDGIIYAIGGEVQAGWWRKHVEAYDPAADTWVKKADMLTARAGFSTSVVDGKIFAMDHQSAEAYDPETDTWAQEGETADLVSNFTTCVVDGKIYIFTGVWTSDTVC